MREPVGVVAAIVPWNFPLMIGMWKIAPALACGCTVVVKPAELTSAVGMLRIAELCLEAGLPAGALNVVCGRAAWSAMPWCNHPGVDKVTFTGSPSVGRGIMQGAAGNFKKASRSNSAANPPTSSSPMPIWIGPRASAASGIFFNAGQVCSAGSRVLVQERVYDEVVERLAERAQAHPGRGSCGTAPPRWAR